MLTEIKNKKKHLKIIGEHYENSKKHEIERRRKSD